MNILGIDPGTIKCGYAIINVDNRKYSLIEAGFIDFKEDTLDKKMLYLNLQLDNIFNNFNIDNVSIESMFYAHNPQSFMKLAQFRGAICMKVLQRVGNFFEYTPLQVKKAVTGNGKSKKEQVAFMVSKIFGLKTIIKPYDVSDAIAVAVTHAQRLT
jgi:crossover junction endodeoxyribonuclease RuvC